MASRGEAGAAAGESATAAGDEADGALDAGTRGQRTPYTGFVWSRRTPFASLLRCLERKTEESHVRSTRDDENSAKAGATTTDHAHTLSRATTTDAKDRVTRRDAPEPLRRARKRHSLGGEQQEVR